MMNPFAQRWRKIQRAWRDLQGYLDLDPSNEIVRLTDFNNCPRPVLLLCGFLSTRRTFEVLEKRLRRDGYGVWSINLGQHGLRGAYNTGRIEQSAEYVREKVERLYARFPRLGPLSIIGHSKGGLIGHYYVKRLGGHARVNTLLTLGTPHHGTPAAYLGCALMGLFSQSVWQMTPRSPFIRRLHLGEFPSGVRLASLYSRADRVARYPSGVLHAPGGNVANLELMNVSHREFLYKKAVYKVIRRELALAYGDKPEAPPLRVLQQLAR